MEVPPVTAADFALPSSAEAEAEARVAAARLRQEERGAELGIADPLNVRLGGDALDRACALDDGGRAPLSKAGEAGALTARGWTRILRLTRTIADLDGAEGVRRLHVAEALGHRRSPLEVAALAMPPGPGRFDRVLSG